jgi:hypothetical protein
MDAEVKALKVVPPPQPNEHMLAMLDDFRERVMKGELNYLGIVATYHDTGAVTSGWVQKQGVLRYIVLGAIEAMKIDYAFSNCVGK